LGWNFAEHSSSAYTVSNLEQLIWGQRFATQPKPIALPIGWRFANLQVQRMGYDQRVFDAECICPVT